jgi:hypothetical protein
MEKSRKVILSVVNFAHIVGVFGFRYNIQADRLAHAGDVPFSTIGISNSMSWTVGFLFLNPIRQLKSKRSSTGDYRPRPNNALCRLK